MPDKQEWMQVESRCSENPSPELGITGDVATKANVAVWLITLYRDPEVYSPSVRQNRSGSALLIGQLNILSLELINRVRASWPKLSDLKPTP